MQNKGIGTDNGIALPIHLNEDEAALHIALLCDDQKQTNYFSTPLANVCIWFHLNECVWLGLIEIVHMLNTSHLFTHPHSLRRSPPTFYYSWHILHLRHGPCTVFSSNIKFMNLKWQFISICKFIAITLQTRHSLTRLMGDSLLTLLFCVLPRVSLRKNPSIYLLAFYPAPPIDKEVKEETRCWIWNNCAF